MKIADLLENKVMSFLYFVYNICMVVLIVLHMLEVFVLPWWGLTIIYGLMAFFNFYSAVVLWKKRRRGKEG